MQTPGKGNFTERAVNKFIELVLSRLVDAERLQVRIKSTLKKLSRGELDALTIQMFNFLLQPNLRVAEFQLEIGPSAVNTQSIMHRKIELLHPSEGELRIAIAPERLTVALTSELGGFSSEKPLGIEFKQVICELNPDGAIALNFQWLGSEGLEVGSYIAVPKIVPTQNQIILIQQNSLGQKIPSEFAERAIAKLLDILNLNDLANQGTNFSIQRIDLEAGQVTLQAIAYVEQFPSG